MQMMSGSGKLDAFEKAFFRNLYQLRRFRADLFDSVRTRSIRMKALVNKTGVQAYDIALF